MFTFCFFFAAEFPSSERHRTFRNLQSRFVRICPKKLAVAAGRRAQVR
jgi:hypothetical protein